ncbi:MAG: hypothetical protein GXO48_00515 [Chlorobi bacterium]|nr:hypothetical protein [Chlorobiota bacterium]
MFGIAHFQNFTDSIVITNWRWQATPLQELPKPYDKYLVSDPESFVLLNDTTIAFPTVNYDWKFDRTICYILPFFCQIRYTFKKKFTPSVVSYTFNTAKEGFLRHDTVLPPYRNFRQYLIGSETGSILTQVAGKTYIFPTKVAFEYDKVGNKKIKQELDVVNNKKKKHIGILGILFVGNKLNKIPAFLINVESVNDNTAILYFRFGNHYLQIYDNQWRTRVTLPLDSLEAYKTCLNTLKDNNKVLCFFGKTAIDLPNRKLFMFTATPKGNKLYIYKF